MKRRPQPKGVPLSGPMVREKEKRRTAYFKGPDGSCSGECTDRGFQASEGWFNKFKVRQSLQNIKIVGEAGSADTVAAERYPKEFANLVADGGYKPEQLQLVQLVKVERLMKKPCWRQEFIFLAEPTPSLYTPNVLPFYTELLIFCSGGLHLSKSFSLQVEASLLNQVAWLALLGRGPVGAVLFVFVESFSEEISTLERKKAVQNF
uniref:HTH CENPB-type domain-containing protein n=1 Tax=Glossina palpalis gambiensis TaxID=67801 RepID=A0A1B0BWW2_9MUSC